MLHNITLPTLQIKHYYFKATIIPSLVTLAMLYIMISLGFWQLDHAEYKANLQSLIQSKQGSAPIPLNRLSNDLDNALYQPVFAHGDFDTDHQIYLDNQVHNMIAGYAIFTPLKLSDNLGILVNRGWTPLGTRRSELPNIDIQAPVSRLDGLAAQAPSKGLVLSSLANTYTQWPSVLQYIDISEIEQHLNYKLMPMVIIMNQAEQTPFTPLAIKINMRSEKHTAYAFQWYGLSLTLFIIYIVVNTKNTQSIKV